MLICVYRFSECMLNTVKKHRLCIRSESNQGRCDCVVTIMGYVFFGVAASCMLLRFFYFQAMIIMGNKEETALFIGNRDCYKIQEKDIEQAIIEAINLGIKEFLNGGQGHFDRTSAIVLYRLKEQYPDIKSILVIPYRDFWIFDKSVFDEIVYPFDPRIEPMMNYKIAIPYRNKAMVLC